MLLFIDWQKLHDQQVTALSNAHKEEMAELKAGFEEELTKYKVKRLCHWLVAWLNTQPEIIEQSYIGLLTVPQLAQLFMKMNIISS